jgi:7-cyano-7-deazaguanine reductase
LHYRPPVLALYLYGMTEKPSAVPPRGPLPRPENPTAAREYLREAAFEAPDVDSVCLMTEEFTSYCPLTGQPDFGTVEIEYRPDRLCIESRALKYYLWSYRDEGAFYETVAARIADDVVYAIAPRRVEVRVTQRPRGGIGIVATAVREA